MLYTLGQVFVSKEEQDENRRLMEQFWAGMMQKNPEVVVEVLNRYFTEGQFMYLEKGKPMN